MSVKCRQCVWTTRAVLGLRVPWWCWPSRLWMTPRPGLHAGIKQILPHQMTTAGPVLGEGRGSDAFFDALDHVIDVHGHIIGMGLSPDNRWAWCAGRDATDGLDLIACLYLICVPCSGTCM